MLRLALALAATLAAAPALPQNSNAAQQVQLLAPQLVAFSGSPANFQSLANGLVQGSAISLSSFTPDGQVQTVSIAPSTPMSPSDAARTLEAARQALIARGVAQPTAQQIATALQGGTLSTAAGASRLAGVQSGTVNSGAVQVQQQPALAAAPGAPAAANTVNQSLQAATRLLFSQGITNPTADQLRTALLGGTLATPAGTNVAVRGVLQGANSPASPTFTTANPTFTTANPTFTTSNPTFITGNPTFTQGNPGFSAASPVVTTVNPSLGSSSVGASGPNGAPSPAAQMQGRR